MWADLHMLMMVGLVFTNTEFWFIMYTESRKVVYTMSKTHDFSKVVEAFNQLNEEWFDLMLPQATFMPVVRGDYSVRYVGDNVYYINVTRTVTHNDLVVEMVYHLDNKPHDRDYVHNQMQLEARNRGFIPELDKPSPTLYVGSPVNIPKGETKMHLWMCKCPTHNKVRCTKNMKLDATCNNCNHKFEKQEVKQNDSNG